MQRRFEIPTFLGETMPVEFVARLGEWSWDGRSLHLHCHTNHYRPVEYDYYGTVCETVWEPPQQGESVTVRIDVVTASILRIRYAPGETVPDNETPMVVGAFPDPVAADIAEREEQLVLETAELRLIVQRDPWQLRLEDLNGRPIWHTLPVDIPALDRPPMEEQWNPPQQRWIFLHRYAYPLGRAASNERRLTFASFGLAHDEHIYGFGESYGRLDKRETLQTLWIQEGFSNASQASYKRVPFYMSSRGYGLFVNSSHPMRFRVGELEHTALSAIIEDADLFDAYLIYGPQLSDVLSGYTAVTGRPAVPPKWSFGLWMGRISYNTQEQVETVAEELRRRRIPCDVIHIDTGWYAEDWQCDLQFGEQNFPEPEGMLQRLRDDGFRVSLWQWPNMVLTSAMYSEGRKGGYLVKKANGEPFLFTGFGPDAGLIDYTNPEAVAWVQEKFRALLQMGVAAIKTDFGEGAPTGAQYNDGEAAAMHNLYPLIYNEAVYDVTKEVHGEDEGLVWSRSAWAGSQRYPVHWSGDGVARYEDLACVLRSALSFGLSGFPFYSHDIGGFSGIPAPELYVRWAQLAFFGSHVRLHGQPPREPWEYGEEADRIFKFYDELRYRLLPYIYSEAVFCGQTSLPMMRPLLLDYADDPTAVQIDDQYLFGRNLLVAPILDEQNQRMVYLPAGRWVDYWEHTVLEGSRWIPVNAPLDRIPLFVKAGGILPYGPLQQFVGEKLPDPLQLDIFSPQAAGHYKIYEQDGTIIDVQYETRATEILVTVNGAPGEVNVNLIGSDRPVRIEKTMASTK